MDAKAFLDANFLLNLGDKYPKISNKIILERFKYSKDDSCLEGLKDYGMVLCFVTKELE